MHRVSWCMRNSLRLSVGTLVLVASAACSRAPDQTMPDDLKADLARVGGGSDVQLAGAAAPKLEFVSASERTNSPAPAPKAPNIAKAPSTAKGTRAPAKSVHHDTPAPAAAKVNAE